MSRSGSGETIVVKPKSDIYTVLGAVCVVVVIVGLVLLIMQAKKLMPPNGLF